ncbi:MAG TPA: inositol monophosphatase family protein [Actinomycetales bacterium]|uniref:inositol monophosphatase family protein n=1 Tax=uncultured Corynebacterium sp. TaxID=159447 RepID=UPI00176EC571|nr:inositol monophosphatase family protein [uncultured Corynebacterium sp.]HHU44101.1 inositol monophosphatase family protein [Actinomycetales bacterium]
MAELEPRALLAMAEAAVDEVEALFTSGLGADPLITKARGDFATEVDLAIERRLRELLQHFTGFPVYGEEYGGSGADPLQDTVWVVDPIDGTTNYAAGFPMCAILVALLHKGEPVVALASMPLLCMRVTATLGGGTRVNGREVHMDPKSGRPVSIAFGSVIARRDGTFPRPWRQLLLAQVGERYRTIRISGSVGVDLATTAAGSFGGTVTFSPHVWDNAVGVLLIREAGGVVTDLAGEEWHTGSLGVLAGTEEVHAGLLHIVKAIQPPDDFRA